MTIAFGILGMIALIASLMVVLARNPVVSALWLALSFAAVAGLFVLLGAEFLAAIQLIVYAGAILVFVLFVIMLLKLGPMPPAESGRMHAFAGTLLALAVAAIIGLAVSGNVSWGERSLATSEAVAKLGNTEAIASLMFTDYIVAFELTSLLLTVAVVGALTLARRRTEP